MVLICGDADRPEQILVFYRFHPELRDVCLHQVRQKQMRKRRELPRVCFFFVEDDANKVVQSGVNLLVVSLQAVFKSGNRAWEVLEESGYCLGGLVSDHGLQVHLVLVDLYLTSRL